MFSQTINIIQKEAEIGIIKLIPKGSAIPSHFLVFISISILLIALARLTGKRLIATHGEALFSTSHLSNFMRDGLKLTDFFTFILLINSIFCTSYLIFLFVERYSLIDIHSSFKIIFIFLGVTLLFFWQLIINWLMFLVTGERQICLDNFNNTLLSYPLRGLILLPLLLILILSPNASYVCFWITAIALGIFQIIRILRCFIYAISNKVDWYYIILYFCTLEILPFVVIYYNFVGKV